MNELKANVVDRIISDFSVICDNTSKSFPSYMRRIATWDSPYVDYAFQDVESGKTLAFIFDGDKDVDSVKKQCVKALNSFDGVLSCFIFTRIDHANVLYDQIENEGLDALPIGIITYDFSSFVTIKRLMIPENKSIKKTSKEQKSYWCWWRDASHYEVADLILLSVENDEYIGDLYSDVVYPKFFDMMINGQTRQWNGTPRSKKYSVSSFKAEKQNYKIPLVQLGLWDAATGHITSKGKLLHEVIKKYGVESDTYFDALSKLILIDGKHLDLIKDLDEFQKKNKVYIPETSSDFFVLFDEYMAQKNSMGTRKPSAITTGAKKAYIRDEAKLWNKLGFIKSSGSARYFTPYKGIEFDWDKINRIILSNPDGGIYGQL